MATTVTMLDPNNVARKIPADQEEAALKAGGRIAVKILDPKGTARWIPESQKDAALAAGGKLAPTTTQSPSTAPSVPPSPLITAGEGQYQMKGKDEKPVSVSYSHVLDAIHNGYNFVDRKTLDTFARDHAADPNNAEHRSDAEVAAMSNWNPAKYLAIVGKVPLDVLQGVGGEALKTATAFDKPSTSRFETELQLAADTPTEGIPQAIGAGGEQVGELAAVPETGFAEAAKVGKIGKTALTVAEQGLRAASEQGVQQYVKSGGDTGQAKTAAEWGGALGAASPFLAPVMEKVGNFGLEVERFFNKTSDIQTRNIVRETMEANEAITKKAEDIRAENAQKIADADKAHADKVAKAKAKYDEAVSGRQTAAEKATLKQQHAEEQAALDHEHAVEKARLKHEQEVADRQELEAKAAVTRQTQLKLRNRLTIRLQTIQKAAQAYFKKNYDEVEDAVGNRSVPISDLADAVGDAKQKIEGSDESIKVFNDITKKMHGVERAEKASGLSEEELENLAPDELAMLRKEGGAPQSVTFGDLKGYYSELGRMLASESVPGDVKQAVVALRGSIDDMQQKLANEAGVGARYRVLRQQYQNYARSFLDYQGPRGEASLLAKAVRKEDPYTATKDFLGKEPEEIARVKRLLSGDSMDESTQFVEGYIETPDAKKPSGIGPRTETGLEPAWRYRKQASQLLDNFIKSSKEADRLASKLKNAEPIGEFVPPEYKPPKPITPKEQKPIGEFVEPEKPPVKGLKKEPQPKVISPEKLHQMKVDALFKQSNIVNHFGIYMVAGGLIGGVAELVRTGNPEKSFGGAVEGAAVGIGGGAVSPYLLARMADRDDVIKALTTVTDKDLMRLARLPYAERQGVEQTLRELAEEAQAKGKLTKPSPWLRILGGTAARKTGIAMQPTPTQEAPGESEQDIEKDLQQMQQQVNQ